MSGFLTIQLEVQNFLSSEGLGGPTMHTDLFRRGGQGGSESGENRWEEGFNRGSILYVSRGARTERDAHAILSTV